jgi:hypothetical protein
MGENSETEDSVFSGSVENVLAHPKKRDKVNKRLDPLTIYDIFLIPLKNIFFNPVFIL